MVRVVTRGVAGVDVTRRDRGGRPGQRVEGGEQAGLVLLHGQDELCAAGVQVLGVGALAVEGVL